MNTKQLSYIISIAEHQSLSAAAARLGVSQPALSKYLAELEQELGTELFLHHKKRMYLTSAGKIYVDAARRILTVKAQTYQTIASLSGQVQRSIVVGVTPLRGAIALARIFTDFRRQYPNINIVFKEQYTAELRQSVLNLSVNMALSTCSDLEDPELLQIPSHEEDILLFVPSFHPLAPLASPDLNHPAAIDICSFQDTPFLLCGQGSTIRRLNEEIFRQNQMNPTIIYESNNNLLLKNMVQSGAGVCLLPRSLAEPSRDIVYFSLKPNYFINLSIMTAKNHPLSEEERYLIALIFASRQGNPNYRFRPSPLAKEIIEEFALSQPVGQTFPKYEFSF